MTPNQDAGPTARFMTLLGAPVFVTASPGTGTERLLDEALGGAGYQVHHIALATLALRDLFERFHGLCAAEPARIAVVFDDVRNAPPKLVEAVTILAEAYPEVQIVGLADRPGAHPPHMEVSEVMLRHRWQWCHIDGPDRGAPAEPGPPSRPARPFGRPGGAPIRWGDGPGGPGSGR